MTRLAVVYISLMCVLLMALLALKEIERVLDELKNRLDTIERDYQEELDRLRKLYAELKEGAE